MKSPKSPLHAQRSGSCCIIWASIVSIRRRSDRCLSKSVLTGYRSIYVWNVSKLVVWSVAVRCVRVVFSLCGLPRNFSKRTEGEGYLASEACSHTKISHNKDAEVHFDNHCAQPRLGSESPC